MFACSSRTDTLFLETRKKFQKGKKLKKIVPSFSSGNSGFCTSETKHDRSTMPRTKLFVSARRLQEQRPQSQKTVLGASPNEDGFCSSETKHDRIASRPNTFVSARRLQEQRP
jgi:hypothetical protein